MFYFYFHLHLNQQYNNNRQDLTPKIDFQLENDRSQ